MEVNVLSAGQSDSTLNRAKEIARTEMVRRRRRLGNLTQEQESAIEILLLSTVVRASELIKPILKIYNYELTHEIQTRR